MVQKCSPHSIHHHQSAQGSTPAGPSIWAARLLGPRCLSCMSFHAGALMMVPLSPAGEGSDQGSHGPIANISISKWDSECQTVVNFSQAGAGHAQKLSQAVDLFDQRGSHRAS